MYIIPNVLTVLRLLMVPLVVQLMLEKQMTAALVVFVVAGLTDGLDGYLAEQNNWRTDLGAWLDPLADKALLVSIYITLGLFGAIPVWFVVLVVVRDIFIVAGIGLSWLLRRPVPVRPLIIGKVHTAGMIVLAALLLADLGLHLGFGGLTDGLVYILAGVTVLSALAYSRSLLAHLRSVD